MKISKAKPNFKYIALTDTECGCIRSGESFSFDGLGTTIVFRDGGVVFEEGELDLYQEINAVIDIDWALKELNDFRGAVELLRQEELPNMKAPLKVHKVLKVLEAILPINKQIRKAE